MKRDIKDLDLSELEALFREWKEPAYRARQVFSWIYQKRSADFSEISCLSLALRRKLDEEFYLRGLNPLKVLKSGDGTEKFLFKLWDGHLIEAVLIPAEGRNTGCVSSQVGCKYGCFFCASGMPGFKRNLSTGEILEEVLNFKDPTHIVFMGTGEPLDNYDNVLKAVRIINSPQGLNIGARKITISTCGLVPGIKRLAEEGLQVELSISLHAADRFLREKIMPVTRKYPLDELLETCRWYFRKTNRQITFEYTLVRGLNSDLQSAGNLSRILKGFDAKVNLIPANPVPELNISPPNKLEILLFRDALLKAGVNVTLRKPRGQDIDAACGQLRLRHEKKDNLRN